MALGGFTGSDPIRTLDAPQQRIAAGLFRYFPLGGEPGDGSDAGQRPYDRVSATR